MLVGKGAMLKLLWSGDNQKRRLGSQQIKSVALAAYCSYLALDSG